MRQTLPSLKMGNKDGKLYTFIAIMFTSTKGSEHSPAWHWSAQPDVLKILLKLKHTSRLKIKLLVAGTLFVTCCW